MSMNLTDDIKSVTDLKRHTSAVIEQVQRTKRPVVLTVNGKAEAVLMGACEYDKIVAAFNLSKLLAVGEEDIRAGRYKEARQFFRGLRRG